MIIQLSRIPSILTKFPSCIELWFIDDNVDLFCFLSSIAMMPTGVSEDGLLGQEGEFLTN